MQFEVLCSVGILHPALRRVPDGAKTVAYANTLAQIQIQAHRIQIHRCKHKYKYKCNKITTEILISFTQLCLSTPDGGACQGSRPYVPSSPKPSLIGGSEQVGGDGREARQQLEKGDTTRSAWLPADSYGESFFKGGPRPPKKYDFCLKGGSRFFFLTKKQAVYQRVNTHSL